MNGAQGQTENPEPTAAPEEQIPAAFVALGYQTCKGFHKVRAVPIYFCFESRM